MPRGRLNKSLEAFHDDDDGDDDEEEEEENDDDRDAHSHPQSSTSRDTIPLLPRRGELLTDGALDAMDCAQHAQKAVG